MPAGNIVIKAQWKKDVYTISYNLNGGKADNPETYEVDTSVITLKRPQRKVIRLQAGVEQKLRELLWIL